MNIIDIGESTTCGYCENKIPTVQRHCPTCYEDAGAPNVRAAQSKSNIDELESRYRRTLSDFGNLSRSKLFEDFVENNSNVVITIPARILISLITDYSQIYSNYEHLITAGVKKPTSIVNESQRYAVGALLFGSYANEIRYGILSANGKGLATYGDVHCKIKNSAIMRRTTFLEDNSYDFIILHDIAPGGSVPLGYTSDWSRRSKLATIKLLNKLSNSSDCGDWSNILFSSDGHLRSNDDFIEAHIYGGFDNNAIESINVVEGKNFSRDEKLDLKIAFAKFKDS